MTSAAVTRLPDLREEIVNRVEQVLLIAGDVGLSEFTIKLEEIPPLSHQELADLEDLVSSSYHDREAVYCIDVFQVMRLKGSNTDIETQVKLAYGLRR